VAAAVPPVARRSSQMMNAVARLMESRDFERVRCVFKSIGNGGGFAGSFWFATGTILSPDDTQARREK